ncbi:hypothetical protein IT570_01620 [Candidatus Sumerlaeota bacterium]|nr:hypothetical protein [Candidatus Sumerlaeota bacterium]
MTSAQLEAQHSTLFRRLKVRVAVNAIRHIKSHLYLHAIVGVGLLATFLALGTGIFYYIFSFLMRQPVFGAPLMDRLVGIVFLIFFSMLLFSNLIITLSTTYLSREVEFLMGLPISRQSIFRQKLIESVVYSSWAFAVLSIPIFVSFGVVRDAPWYYYILIVLLIVPFLMVPASLGAIVTMFLTSFLPARKTRTLAIVLGIVCLGATFAIGRITGLGKILATADQQDLLQIMSALGIGGSPLLPSAWLSNALQSIAPADPSDRSTGMFLYWLGMLSATSLFLLEVTHWLVPKLYYRGWTLSRDATVREVESHAKFSPFRHIDAQLEKWLPPSTAGLLGKDLKTFWRDPSQWTQLVILFGLMVIYVTNLGWSTRYGNTIGRVIEDTNWRLILSFFNLAATCFILSILTTRFVYPMLSLEGRGFWTVGLAPIPRTRIVWQKFALCLLLCICVSVPLTILSDVILQVPGRFLWISLASVIVMSTGLTSMSVGIGAILPDFKEDNPARIANGIGGTLNVLLSLIYIAISVASIALPFIFARAMNFSSIQGIGYVACAVALQVFAIVFPLRLGLRRWERLEF